MEDRIKEFKTGNSSVFNIVEVYHPNNYAVTIEKKMHRYFKNKLVNGEWFDLTNDGIYIVDDYCLQDEAINEKNTTTAM